MKKNPHRGLRHPAARLPALLLALLTGLLCFLWLSSGGHRAPSFVPLRSRALSDIGALPGASNLPENSDLPTPAEESGPLIRVLLHTAGYQGLRHESISVTSGERFAVYSDGARVDYEAGAVFIPPDGGQADDMWRIEGAAGLSVKEIVREQGCPIYKGSLYIYRMKEGYAVVNELPLEDYVAGVLPGEVPSSFEEEAIRAQAVCARSYAACRLGSYAYEEYRAHVDDSTNFQVYGNRSGTEKTKKAARDTAGEILSYEGEIIATYFFSSSWGSTTDISIWQENPADYPYLPAATLQAERRSTGCSEEAMFRARMNDKDRAVYDADAPFYRWKIRVSADAMSESLNAWLLREGYESIGRLCSLSITGRGGGGIATELRAEGEAGFAMLRGQGIIREALGNAGWEIQRETDAPVTGWRMLPSAFIYIDEDEDAAGNRVFTIVGGGYGHGVGLSQHGANGMAARGFHYREILRYFYPGSELKAAD